MRRVIIDDWMSLDGIIQGPAYPDEDSEGGFANGGWHMPFMDEVAMKWVIDNLSDAVAFIFGRRTYDIFAAFWPNAPENQRALADPLNRLPKFVASTALTEPLTWANSTLLTHPLPSAVAQLKHEGDGNLHILGSTQVASTLLQHGLVDEVRLMIDPVLVGGGKRLFPEDRVLRGLRPVSTKTTPRGAILATYGVTN